MAMDWRRSPRLRRRDRAQTGHGIGNGSGRRADYRKFDTDNFMEYNGYEDVRECEPSFVAPFDGAYCLLLINDGDEDVNATFECAVWKA